MYTTGTLDLNKLLWWKACRQTLMSNFLIIQSHYPGGHHNTNGSFSGLCCVSLGFKHKACHRVQWLRILSSKSALFPQIDSYCQPLAPPPHLHPLPHHSLSYIIWFDFSINRAWMITTHTHKHTHTCILFIDAGDSQPLLRGRICSPRISALAELVFSDLRLKTCCFTYGGR